MRKLTKNCLLGTISLLLLAILAYRIGIFRLEAWAEYGDVILNQRSAQEGMRPVVFPHWFHRIRFRCKVCHDELGFVMRAGGNEIDMNKIVDGQYCGACHDGNTAWSTEHCDLCHSGLPELPTGVKGGLQTSGPGRY